VGPEKFTETYNLPPIQYFSASSFYLNQSDIYTKLVTVASLPKLYPMRKTNWRFFQNFVNSIISTTSLQQSHSIAELMTINPFIKYSLIATACLTLSFIMFRIKSN
jgi:hypothetical protein